MHSAKWISNQIKFIWSNLCFKMRRMERCSLVTSYCFGFGNSRCPIDVLTSVKSMSLSGFHCPKRRGNLGTAGHAMTSLLEVVTCGLQNCRVSKVPAAMEAAMELSLQSHWHYLVDLFMKKCE